MLRQVVTTVARGLSIAGHLLGTIILILFLVLLVLIEGPKWRAKLTSVDRDNSKWEGAMLLIGKQFRRYFLTRLALGTITGLLYMAWLALFGIDLILVWGLLALLLNFVPTVGSLIAGIFPVLFAFATRDAGTAALVASGLLVIEQVMGNYVDPRLLGKRLTISPLVVLISLLVWSWVWVWGIGGALIAVPMTLLLTISFAQVPALRPVVLFLSNERDIDDLNEHVGPAASLKKP